MRRRNNDFQLAGTKRQCGNLKQFFRCQDPPNQKDPTLPEGYPLLPLNIQFFLGGKPPEPPSETLATLANKPYPKKILDPPLICRTEIILRMG